jgi:hypothetical protein
MNLYRICVLFIVILSACSTVPKTSLSQDVLRKSSEYYVDNGGKGIRLAILEPEYKSVNSDDSWLPMFIQGTLANNINIFSEITVLDRQNLEKILKEQELSMSGNFSDDDSIRIGHLTNAQYVLTGTLMNISNMEIALQLSITDTETGERKASFVKNCTVGDIKNAAIVNEATSQLLSQIGVKLTEKGEELLLSLKISTNNAETALSKGIAAQKKGTIVEAMSYYYDATLYNPALTEAYSRLSSTSAYVKTGNIGADARNEIEKREAWRSILAQCGDYYQDHLPIEIKYNPKLTQAGINYQQGTVDLQFSVSSYRSPNIEIIQNILAGLKKTNKKEEWGFGSWPISYKPYVDDVDRYSGEGTKTTTIVFSLINEDGATISTTRAALENSIQFAQQPNKTLLLAQILSGAATIGGGWGMYNALTKEGKDSWLWYLLLEVVSGSTFFATTFGVVMEDSFRFLEDNIHRIRVKPDTERVVFRNVNAYDITDKLTIKILSINGIDADVANQTGYVRIISEEK